MRIGEIAAASGVTAKALRFYESIGLLPQPGRTPSGYRDYPIEVVDRLVFIRDAQAAGLTLAEITSVLELKDSGTSACEHTSALLRRHLAELDDRIRSLRETRDRLADLARRSSGLDPAACTDPHRCQVIQARR